MSCRFRLVGHLYAYPALLHDRVRAFAENNAGKWVFEIRFFA
jgi:hypothetical protein